MESLLSQLLIPDLADLVCEYYYPDYKKQYGAVLRDLNWVAGDQMMGKLGTILVLLLYYDDDVWKKATSMIQTSRWGQYDRVMSQLITGPYRIEFNSDDRFFTQAINSGCATKREKAESLLSDLKRQLEVMLDAMPID